MTISLETEIRTGRLVLRPLADADAPAVQALAGDERVSRYTARIPYPYPDGEAERFIAAARQAENTGKCRTFAIALGESPDRAIGMMLLEVDGDGAVELGYWLGAPWWGQGYMSEAVAAAAAYARRWRPGAMIGAHTFPQNVGSQRVLEKAGFVRRGTKAFDAPARGNARIEDAPVFVLASDGAD